MSMLKPRIGTAIAASESERILTIAIGFDRIGSRGAVNGGHEPIPCGSEGCGYYPFAG
jgi:hypothetical protein